MARLKKKTSNILKNRKLKIDKQKIENRVTLYLNGVYQKVPAGDYAALWHDGEMVPAGYIGGDQQLYVMGMWQSYGGGGAISPAASLGTSFGHILVYQKALTHSELRQNYLAQKGVYYKFREGL